jgi:FixJ family two-component response regulator
MVANTPLILVVDDDASLRSALESLVRSIGYDVRSFSSAEAVLESGSAAASACIISDIQMPGLSGIELEKRLRTQQVATPVILITARSEPELLAAARASSAICVLRKPFDASALIGCLEKAIG